MKRILSVGLVIALTLISCGLFERRPVTIDWPENISYVRALCDVDLRWKGMEYSGSMSLVMEYPDALSIEIYGPFGETEVLIRKKRDEFLFRTKEEVIEDPHRFREKYEIDIGQLMEDIAMRGPREREGYRVLHGARSGTNDICWVRDTGKICMTFIEAVFSP